MDRNREGFFRPISKYPLGWPRLAVGSVPRLCFALAVHILGFAAISVRLEFGFWHVVLFAFVLWFPGHYLYALYRLVKIINVHEENIPPDLNAEGHT
jgi:hypothetical protein